MLLPVEYLVQAVLHHRLYLQPQLPEMCRAHCATSSGDVSRCGSACDGESDVVTLSDFRCCRCSRHRNLFSPIVIATSISTLNRDASNAAGYAVMIRNLAHLVSGSLPVQSKIAQAGERSRCYSDTRAEGHCMALPVLAYSRLARVFADIAVRRRRRRQSCWVKGCSYVAIVQVRGTDVGRSHSAVAEVSTDTEVRVAPEVGSFGNTRLLPFVCDLENVMLPSEVILGGSVSYSGASKQSISYTPFAFVISTVCAVCRCKDPWTYSSALTVNERMTPIK